MIDKLCLTLNISPKSYLIMFKVVLRFFHRHHWRLNLIICNARHAFYRGSVAGDGDDEDVSQSSSIGFCRLNWDPGFAWAYTLMRLVSVVSWCDVHWSQNIRGFYQLCRIGQIYLQCFVHLVYAKVEYIPANFAHYAGHHSRPWTRCRSGWLWSSIDQW